MASSEEEKEQERIWLDVFKLFDKDNNGTICQIELRFVMRALNLDPTEKELKEAMDTLGKNGKITYDNFVKYMKKKKQSNAEERRQDMLNAFRLMDKNLDKHLDADELISVLTRLGEPLTSQEAEAMIRVADVNKDGKIDYEEFVDFLIAPYLQCQQQLNNNMCNKRRFSGQRRNLNNPPQQQPHPQPQLPPQHRPPVHHHTTSTMSQQSLGFEYSAGDSRNNSMNNYFRAADSTDSDFSMRTQPEVTDTSEDTYS